MTAPTKDALPSTVEVGNVELHWLTDEFVFRAERQRLKIEIYAERDDDEEPGWYGEIWHGDQTLIRLVCDETPEGCAEQMTIELSELRMRLQGWGL